MSIGSKRFSLAQIGAIAVIVSVLASAATLFINNLEKVEEKSVNAGCNYSVKRIEGYNYVKPLLLVDEDCESEDLASVKYKINSLIEKEKGLGNLTSASIYLRSKNQWTTAGSNEGYEPGSLFKVPILMTILKMCEDNPGFLNKQIRFNQHFTFGRTPNFPGKSIEFGKTYTVAELLEYMIRWSDNSATCLLEMNMDKTVLHKLFTDHGLEAPNLYADKFFFTPKHYSMFMRSIYNASYLSIKNSEYAAALLSKCEFKDGIMKGVPAGLQVAHKYGETGHDTEKQLHETAIVYLKNRPYLLTVMTKGSNFPALQQFIGEVSKIVYDEMQAKAEL